MNKTQFRIYSIFVWLAILCCIPFIYQIIALLLGTQHDIPIFWQLILATIVQFCSGYFIYREAFHALLGRRGNIDLLISLGTSAAYGLSFAAYIWDLPTKFYFDVSTMTITLTLLGHWLDARGLVMYRNHQSVSERLSSSKIEELSKLLAPILLILSLFTWLASMANHGNVMRASINSLTILIVTCPTALGIALPIITVIANGLGSKFGIFFKNSKILNKASKIDTLLINKTGTLTYGIPSVDGVYPVVSYTQDELLYIAISLEKKSTHSLALALQDECKKRKITGEDPKSLEYFPGKGVAGIVHGTYYHLGSLSFAKEHSILIDPTLFLMESQGEEFLVLWNPQGIVGYISMTDLIRPTCVFAIQRLNKMSIHPVLVTGDRQATANAIATKVGIQDAHGNLSPEDKYAYLMELKASGAIVGMIGNGTNDIKALEEADVGFEMGIDHKSGAKIIDITLQNKDLINVVHAIELSRKSTQKMYLNIFFAFIFNFLSIPFAAMGNLTQVVVAGTMAMSIISILANSLLLKYWKPKEFVHE